MVIVNPVGLSTKRRPLAAQPDVRWQTAKEQRCNNPFCNSHDGAFGRRGDAVTL
jgi:hypothetical protein